ncbi:MAG: branched-chain amino acid ABC transporter permease [Clostridiales Family XIII bacterium]|jgi:branched-chain amino acid transport system permease protein|nr:branched-chain amino acid ABC transporter permease [Clostridiales Family XIII bacterium]
MIIQPFIRSLETGSVYALAALGIIIVWRTNLVMHFAQGSMGMFSATAVAFVLNRAGLPLWLSVLAGVGVAVLLGFAVDFSIIRRLKKATAVGKEIITLGLIMVFLGLAPIIFGTDPMQLPKFITSGDVQLGGASISYNALLNIIIGIVITLVLFYILQNTKIGLAVRATASSEITARLMGIPTRTVTLFSWATAGVLGMLAGVMIAPTVMVTPSFMNAVQVNALFACVLGGFQTFYGPVIGAYLIAICSNFLKLYVSSVWGEQLMYLIILAFLLFRPNGLVGKTYIKKV